MMPNIVKFLMKIMYFIVGWVERSETHQNSAINGGFRFALPTLQNLMIVMMMLLVSSIQAEEIDKKYYDSGVVQFQYEYRNGKLHGTIEEFYETGELKAEYNYRSGDLIGKKTFSREGKLEYELRYKNNEKYETQYKYYHSGELFRKRSLINGKREGLEVDYYRNGNKKAERNYVDGKKEGSAKGYHYNGKLQGDWVFKNDEPVSAIIFYNSGEKWLEHIFDGNGHLNGTSKEYDKGGNLMAIRYYTDDEMVKRNKIRPWLRWMYIFD
jgi:antitoxin component YwqK of YwqJK toxin-antitoxin module